MKRWAEHDADTWNAEHVVHYPCLALLPWPAADDEVDHWHKSRDWSASNCPPVRCEIEDDAPAAWKGPPIDILTRNAVPRNRK